MIRYRIAVMVRDSEERRPTTERRLLESRLSLTTPLCGWLLGESWMNISDRGDRSFVSPPDTQLDNSLVSAAGWTAV